LERGPQLPFPDAETVGFEFIRPVPRLLCDKAAIDHKLRPGDERGFVRSQEQHSVSHLDRFPDPPQWCHGDLISTFPALVAFSIGGMYPGWTVLTLTPDGPYRTAAAFE